MLKHIRLKEKERSVRTIGPPNVSGTNSCNSGACQSKAGSLLCKFGVLTAEKISMQRDATMSRQVLTRPLRLGREDGGIRSFGRDGSVASGWRYRAIGDCLQGRKRGRVHVESFLCVFALAEFGIVVNVGTGWKVSP
jgi:hypothetical protein